MTFTHSGGSLNTALPPGGQPNSRIGGRATFNDSTIFTGDRWENRFRLLQREHIVNPVFYIEFENTNGADKILKEVEGHDVESDYDESNGALRKEHDHELEMKLLLSSTFKGWNVAVNPIVTKNLLPSGSPGSSRTRSAPAIRWP